MSDPDGAVRRHRLVHHISDLGRVVPAGEKNAIDAQLTQIVVLELPRDVGVGDDREARVLLANRFDFGACHVSAGVVRVNDTCIDRFSAQRLVQGTPRRTHDDLVRSPEGGAHSCRGSSVWLEDG